MSAASTTAALQAGIEQINAEAGGLMDVMVVQLQDMPDIIADAIAGGAEAMMLFNAVSDALKRIDTAPRRLPMLCVSCPRPLRKGRFGFAIALPQCSDPTRAIALAVCNRCATDRDGISAKAVIGLKRIWPDLRPITVTHPTGGRA